MRRYAVRIDFDTPESINSASQIIPFADRALAAALFHRLSRAYVEVKPVPVVGGSTVEVVGAAIYQADDVDDDHGMIRAVKRGEAILVEDTTDLDT